MLVDEVLPPLLGREADLAALLGGEEALELLSVCASAKAHNLLAALLLLARDRIVCLGIVLKSATSTTHTYEVKQPLLWKHLAALAPPLSMPIRSARCAPGKLLGYEHVLTLADAAGLVADGHTADPGMQAGLVSVEVGLARERLRRARLAAGWGEGAEERTLGRWRAMVFCCWARIFLFAFLSSGRGGVGGALPHVLVVVVE